MSAFTSMLSSDLDTQLTAQTRATSHDLQGKLVAATPVAALAAGVVASAVAGYAFEEVVGG